MRRDSYWKLLRKRKRRWARVQARGIEAKKLPKKIEKKLGLESGKQEQMESEQ